MDSCDTEPMMDVCTEIAVNCLSPVLDGDVLVKICVARLGKEDKQMVMDTISNEIMPDGCKKVFWRLENQ